MEVRRRPRPRYKRRYKQSCEMFSAPRACSAGGGCPTHCILCFNPFDGACVPSAHTRVPHGAYRSWHHSGIMDCRWGNTHGAPSHSGTSFLPGIQPPIAQVQCTISAASTGGHTIEPIYNRPARSGMYERAMQNAVTATLKTTSAQGLNRATVTASGPMWYMPVVNMAWPRSRSRSTTFATARTCRGMDGGCYRPPTRRS